jgi:hypothetical protein
MILLLDVFLMGIAIGVTGYWFPFKEAYNVQRLWVWASETLKAVKL